MSNKRMNAASFKHGTNDGDVPVSAGTRGKRNRFYVAVNGSPHEPTRVFQEYMDCQQHIRGVPYAYCRAFGTLEQANQFEMRVRNGQEPYANHLFGASSSDTHKQKRNTTQKGKTTQHKRKRAILLTTHDEMNKQKRQCQQQQPPPPPPPPQKIHPVKTTKPNTTVTTTTTTTTANIQPPSPSPLPLPLPSQKVSIAVVFTEGMCREDINVATTTNKNMTPHSRLGGCAFYGFVCTCTEKDPNDINTDTQHEQHVCQHVFKQVSETATTTMQQHDEHIRIIQHASLLCQNDTCICSTNRARLQACIQTIETIIEHRVTHCIVYTSSKYVKNMWDSWLETWHQNGWRKKSGDKSPPNNMDLVQHMWKLKQHVVQSQYKRSPFPECRVTVCMYPTSFQALEDDANNTDNQTIKPRSDLEKWILRHHKRATKMAVDQCQSAIAQQHSRNDGYGGSTCLNSGATAAGNSSHADVVELSKKPGYLLLE